MEPKEHIILREIKKLDALQEELIVFESEDSTMNLGRDVDDNVHDIHLAFSILSSIYCPQSYAQIFQALPNWFLVLFIVRFQIKL